MLLLSFERQSKIIKIVDFMPGELDKSKIINNYLQNHTVSNYIIIEG